MVYLRCTNEIIIGQAIDGRRDVSNLATAIVHGEFRMMTFNRCYPRHSINERYRATECRKSKFAQYGLAVVTQCPVSMQLSQQLLGLHTT